jgi:tRNA (cytidine/uridine-2'-O-)-methyltransferase
MRQTAARNARVPGRPRRLAPPAGPAAVYWKPVSLQSRDIGQERPWGTCANRQWTDRSMALRLALFEPDIPQNTGAILRLAACLGAAVDLIEPCGFVWSDRRLRRAGMDYLAGVELTRHPSWQAYAEWRRQAGPGRLLLLTSTGELPYTSCAFAGGDTLLLGRESSGVPGHVRSAADMRLVIPLRPGMRSLNVALAGAIVLGEALRQLGPAGHSPQRMLPQPA